MYPSSTHNKKKGEKNYTDNYKIQPRSFPRKKNMVEHEIVPHRMNEGHLSTIRARLKIADEVELINVKIIIHR